MTEQPFNVLFLCTGNSARSVLAESILNKIGNGRFKAFSAGSHPSGAINPHVLEFLEKRNFPTADLRSKSWNEFAAPDGPALDFVFTVCDNAAGEVCPVWPGQPVTAHWGVEDPVSVDGDDDAKRKAVLTAFALLNHRISLFASLPIAKLDAMSLKKELDEIGRMRENGE
ncbi:MAG: arsenate reductase ArsC [Propionivibrio sp.]|nr:arsenate reductase ArsC [Propionivibrio sp.]